MKQLLIALFSCQHSVNLFVWFSLRPPALFFTGCCRTLARVRPWGKARYFMNLFAMFLGAGMFSVSPITLFSDWTMPLTCRTLRARAFVPASAVPHLP
jgi:hypothetical protein